MTPIRHIETGFPVAGLVAEILENPTVWNRHRERTAYYGSVHNEVSDIWARYNHIDNMTGPEFFSGEHESVWYPVTDELPSLKPLVESVFERVGGKRLGGVLITKIPAGGEVKPHIDSGWHASYYEKFAVQLLGNKDQAFCFEGSELRPEPGDLYTFDNSQLHWVKNDSDSDRITCIICIRRDEDAP